MLRCILARVLQAQHASDNSRANPTTTKQQQQLLTSKTCRSDWTFSAQEGLLGLFNFTMTHKDSERSLLLLYTTSKSAPASFCCTNGAASIRHD